MGERKLLSSTFVKPSVNIEAAARVWLKSSFKRATKRMERCFVEVLSSILAFGYGEGKTRRGIMKNFCTVVLKCN